VAHPAPSESRESASDAAPGGARAAVSVTALTGHDDFLLELGEVLGGRASVQPADSLDAALEQLGAGRGGQILAIDARGITDVRADVERASRQVPHAVILVFTDAGAEKTAAAAVKGMKVFAVLPLPVERGKTSAVLEAALTDALQQHAPAGPTAAPPLRQSAPAPRHSPPTPEAAAEEPRPSGSGKRLWLVIGASGLAVAVGAGLYLMQHRAHAVAPLTAATRSPATHPPGVPPGRLTPPLAAPAVDTSIVRGHVEDLLEKASRAMFERRFTAPRGANALVYYRSVLAVDPTNGEALDGLRRVGHVLISRFNDDIAEQHDNRASLALATLRLAEPANAHLRPFGIELSEALVNRALANGPLGTVPALIAQAARRGVPAAQLATWQSALTGLQHKRQLQTIAAQIARRIAANRLTGPASAQTALARLRALAPTAPATQHATQALTDALLRQAREAGLAGHGAAESEWLAAARENGATAEALAALRAQVAAQRVNAAHSRLEQLLADARARLDAGRLLQPANASAAYDLSEIAADHPDTQEAAAANRLRSALAAALVARAESASRAGQHAAALTDLAAARHWGASAAALHAAAMLAAQPPPPTPAQLSEVAEHLRRTHYVAPVYPQRALGERISGQVTVQYVVDKSGRTRNLQVIAAAPAGVFNRAALDAIRRWRYAPPSFHGEPVAVPVRTMIRFVLPN
jgi:TonB family protein